MGRKHKQHRHGGPNSQSQKPRRRPHVTGQPFKMGNEESTPIDESVSPQTLQARTLHDLAAYIKSGKAKKIVVMTGAGISTSAGIPDFRSPETGLYANLARLNLPYAEAVFDISFFRENPEPFYTLAQELYPGKYRPTITHSFIRLLQDKGLLLKLFTQNIDCLEREAGVSDDKIVEAHGSFARQSCIECKRAYLEEDIREHIANKTIPRCHTCQGLVKPEIVFFGEALPPAFFESSHLPREADICIVMGTSLTVQPFANLPEMTREATPRLLINKERVGKLGTGTDDVLLLGSCDDGVRQLAKACGWLGELERLWEKTGHRLDAAEEQKETSEPSKNSDEALEDEIDKITREVDETLNLSRWHDEKVRGEDLPDASNSKTPAASLDDTKGASSKPHEDASGNLDHVFMPKATHTSESASLPNSESEKP